MDLITQSLGFLELQFFQIVDFSQFAAYLHDLGFLLHQEGVGWRREELLNGKYYCSQRSARRRDKETEEDPEEAHSAATIFIGSGLQPEEGTPRSTPNTAWGASLRRTLVVGALAAKQREGKESFFLFEVFRAWLSDRSACAPAAGACNAVA
jgi:hypothetical protein